MVPGQDHNFLYPLKVTLVSPFTVWFCLASATGAAFTFFINTFVVAVLLALVLSVTTNLKVNFVSLATNEP